MRCVQAPHATCMRALSKEHAVHEHGRRCLQRQRRSSVATGRCFYLDWSQWRMLTTAVPACAACDDTVHACSAGCLHEVHGWYRQTRPWSMLERTDPHTRCANIVSNIGTDASARTPQCASTALPGLQYKGCEQPRPLKTPPAPQPARPQARLPLHPCMLPSRAQTGRASASQAANLICRAVCSCMACRSDVEARKSHSNAARRCHVTPYPRACTGTLQRPCTCWCMLQALASSIDEGTGERHLPLCLLSDVLHREALPWQ